MLRKTTNYLNKANIKAVSIEKTLENLLVDWDLPTNNGATTTAATTTVGTTSTDVPPPATYSSTSLFEANVHSNATTKQHQRSFAHRLLLRKPDASFSDVVNKWKLLVNTPQLFTDFCSTMSIREVQLLNMKLGIDEERILAASNATAASSDASDTSAEVSNLMTSDKERHNELNAPRDKAATDKLMRTYLSHYSLAHYGAELGDLDFFQFLERDCPDGLTFVPTPPALHMQSEPQGPSLLAPDVSGYSMRATAPSQMMLPTHEIVARHHDFSGKFVGHHAAIQGNVDLLKHLTSTYGADLILSGQRVFRPLFKDMMWGPSQFLVGLNAAEASVGVGQVPTLEWLMDQHPNVVKRMFNAATEDGKGFRALTCAAMLDAAHIFIFLERKGVLGTNQLRDSCAGNDPSSLAESKLLPSLLAAAEQGCEDVVDWYLDMFGGHATLLAQDPQNHASVLHHCARGARHSLLTYLVAREDFPAEAVDCRDKFGRTPAMWCVLAAKSAPAKRVIKVLDALLSAGSEWPRDVDENGNDVLALARRNLSWHSQVYRYLQKKVRHSST